jgi:hypothetical protein
MTFGKSQIPGIDLNESFAPVIIDVSFRIMLITKLTWNLEASIVNVENEFYMVNFKEIYMNIPEGMSYGSKLNLLSTMTIFGLVQSSRELYQNLNSTFELI